MGIQENHSPPHPNTVVYSHLRSHLPMHIHTHIYIYIYIKNTYKYTNICINNIYIYPVNYNKSLTWIKAIWGWFPLLTMIPVRSQWGRYNLPIYIYIYTYFSSKNNTMMLLWSFFKQALPSTCGFSLWSTRSSCANSSLRRRRSVSPAVQTSAWRPRSPEQLQGLENSPRKSWVLAGSSGFMIICSWIMGWEWDGLAHYNNPIMDNNI